SMGPQVDYFLGKLVGVFHQFGNEFKLRSVIAVFGDMTRNLEHLVQPLVLKHLLSTWIHDQNAVKGRVHLRFKKCSLPSQVFFRILSCRLTSSANEISAANSSSNRVSSSSKNASSPAYRLKTPTSSPSHRS